MTNHEYGSKPEKNMGNFRTKEDDVARISTSVFISNIPDSVLAKDLFHVCKQYGHVVDSYIPFKKDKNGNRFGFVRFINVFNTERLVNNLCTVWIDRYKIKANIAQFQRSLCNVVKNGEVTSKRSFVNSKANVNPRGEISYVGVVKNDNRDVGEDSTSNAALVIGDECLTSKDLSLALLGRVKEFASLVNLKMAIGNEGFAEISIKYMGELWVMLEFHSLETLNKFKMNISIASWFSQIINASNDFETEGRIAWVEVEGVPLKLWSENTFRRIAAKWGNLLDVDDHEDNCYHTKRICIHMKAGRFIKDEFKIIHRGKSYWIQANEIVGWVPDFSEESDDDVLDDNSTDEGSDNQLSGDVDIRYPGKDAGNDSEVEMVQETVFGEEVLGNNQTEGENQVPITNKSDDPFGLYPLLNKAKNNDGSDCTSGNSLKFPPGFTPPADKDEAICKEDAGNNSKCFAFETKDHKEKLNDVASSNYVNLINKRTRKNHRLEDILKNQVVRDQKGRFLVFWRR
ncbi:nucleotide-binding alpha-beta plait domain-containing protein [Tanacetum coccineum]